MNDSVPANHLAGQASPYLAAHAHDPVDWRPWGEDAFDTARELDRPIFLSIGYQSCHWCHVMQRESFKDAETAGLINELFVPVKVDRELRPDVDHLYMSYVSLATGNGGWPLTAILTPDLIPFFGGTYFPKDATAGMPAFKQVLETISLAWETRRDEVEQATDEALEVLGAVMRYRDAGVQLDQASASAIEHVLAMADRANGGIGDAPKFPQLTLVDYLIAHHRATGDDRSLAMARRWVYAMLRGGIYDQAGGGIFRYSTDARWLVPHFEKMLYDSAQLLSTLAKLHHVDPSAELAHTMRQTAEFLVRDLGRPGQNSATPAGFYSSLDAEAEGAEGAPYAWDFGDLAQELTADELDLAERALGVAEEGNWEGLNILTRHPGRDTEALEVDAVLERLLALRMTKPQPALITNTLTEWNALAARGLIEAGVELDDSELVRLGLATVHWLMKETVHGDMVVHAAGDPSVDALGLLEDYAAVIAALVAAADLAGQDEMLEDAERLLAVALERFAGSDGVLYQTAEHTELPVRPVNWHDAPTPSGASMLVRAYERLRPEDEAGRAVLLAPLVRLMDEAPHAVGGALEAVID